MRAGSVRNTASNKTKQKGKGGVIKEDPGLQLLASIFHVHRHTCTQTYISHTSAHAWASVCTQTNTAECPIWGVVKAAS